MEEKPNPLEVENQVETVAEVEAQLAELEAEEARATEAPQVEATTGLKGWAGQTSIKEEAMRDGNISNVSQPFAAFDFECLLYVPEVFTAKVARYEKFPIPWLYNKAIPYYKPVPGAMKKLDELMRFAYNIAIVYVGPKHLWKTREKMLEKFPYTQLICVNTPVDFKEQVTFNEQILQYYTLSAIKAQESGRKGALFNDWGSLGQRIL